MTIELHAFDTPNGRKITVALEEMQLPYTVKIVNISAGEQHRPEFLAISPNNKIPAIVDPHGPGGQPISVFESGAILMYLADIFTVQAPLAGLPGISVPTLLIQASDDPLIPPAALPDRSQLSASTRLELSAKGGHVGFVSGREIGRAHV